ncbi:MAG: BMP family ABC transporter substrate-binding protein, partial [Rhodobacteraceae bacterium]|nr:BMP family ABC transporter substrate-binding protein [Paracoccaceae bacterium]
IERTQAVMDGTWGSQNTWHGIKEGMVAFADMSDKIPTDVRAEALQMIEDLKDGSYHAFTGPINKQDGSAWLAEGETADDGTLAGMSFYVEGITGDIPN